MNETLRRMVLWVALLCISVPGIASAQELTVFRARRIITMDPSLPIATAVAVRDDRIVAVGTMETLQPWLTAHDYEIDDSFLDKVLLPGLIDPHLHPGLGASLLAKNEIIAEDAVMNAETLPAVVMPARDRFVPDDRRGGPEVR